LRSNFFYVALNFLVDIIWQCGKIHEPLLHGLAEDA
jgi:hypothetical protein